MEAEYIRRYHGHRLIDNQCSSCVFKRIKAPVDIVWSLVRKFDEPQKYKPFVSRCTVRGDLSIGSVREVNVKSGLPATTSTERLELLDDQKYIIGVKFVGSDHRLNNYSSIITVHPETMDGSRGGASFCNEVWAKAHPRLVLAPPLDGRLVTLVIESFVVDVPEGNTREETCYFVKALISCNHNSLAVVSERMANVGQSPLLS